MKVLHISVYRIWIDIPTLHTHSSFESSRTALPVTFGEGLQREWKRILRLRECVWYGTSRDFDLLASVPSRGKFAQPFNREAKAWDML